MPCLGIFELEFQKTMVIFEISTLEFAKMWNFKKKWKCLNLGPKNVLFGYFWTGVFKGYYHIWNQHIGTYCILLKFYQRKGPNFGPKMSSLGIFGLEFGNSFLMLKIRTLELISLQTFFLKNKIDQKSLIWVFLD